MKITHCKLSKKVQKRLLDFFVLEVIARSAADLLQNQTNTKVGQAYPPNQPNAL